MKTTFLKKFTNKEESNFQFGGIEFIFYSNFFKLMKLFCKNKVVKQNIAYMIQNKLL